MSGPPNTSTPTPEVEAFYTVELDYDNDGLLQYVGLGTPGVTTSQALWQIKRLTYTDGALTVVEYASSTDKFDKIWTSRTSYSYA